MPITPDHSRCNGETGASYEIRGDQRQTSTQLHRTKSQLSLSRRLSVQAYSVDSQNAQGLGNKGDDRVDRLEQESLLIAESNSSENGGRIVLNDGYTSHLHREL